ncbi:LysR family transcriptional regulator [Alloalcanivorax mobilis]|uniref:LysR family transcriptional regulator n=1 Tax=Alloalcanivorax mobilis TaxID=2019569 RepID=UPI000B5B0D20|nr:LysR family transcriptional regulator [Alloalcanivorax mobilis]ASK33711.1 LysR family transcriptional regulator [Alcanivorax sp. N3-2A]|tara:strand:- start:4515 stop:5417 length:903 start_codon:yes stop_codon:yes gene_type:complete
MKRIAEFTVFVAVVKAGSLSEASRELNLSIASISKYVTRIEEQLGVRLLLRNSRGMRLTEEGADLYEKLDKLLAELNTAVQSVSSSRETPQGTLKITSTIALGRNRVAPLVSEFAASHRELSVQLFLGDRAVDLIGEDIDVAIAIGEPQDPTLVAKRIMSNPCCICASPKYLKRKRMPKHPMDLKAHECLILDCFGSFKDNWVLTDERGGHHSVKVSGSLITDNSETLKEWVLDGYGIALKSQWDIQDHLESGDLVPLLPKYKAPDLDFFMVYAGRDLVPAKTRAFIDFIENNVDRLAHL